MKVEVDMSLPLTVSEAEYRVVFNELFTFCEQYKKHIVLDKLPEETRVIMWQPTHVDLLHQFLSDYIRVKQKHNGTHM